MFHERLFRLVAVSAGPNNQYSRYSEHIRNNQKPRKFHSEAVGSSEVLACTGPISRNPLVTRSVGIL